MLVDPVDAKWTALKAAISDEESLTSGTAEYIYFHYLTDSRMQDSDSGLTITQTDNSEAAIPVATQVRCWNRMAHLSREIRDYLNKNRSLYETSEHRLPSCSGNTGIFGIINDFGI